MDWNPIFVLLIFITIEGTLLAENLDNRICKELKRDLNCHTLTRHSEKRRILGPEHEYFKAYYTEKGLLSVYNRLRRNGLIDDWSPLGATSYSNAIATSTNYYRLQAEAGRNVNAQINRIKRILAYRRQDAKNHGGGDRGHNSNITNWQNGLELIQGGRDRFRNGYRTNRRRNRRHRRLSRHRNSRRRREGNRRRRS
ncbi:uncharacterized protein LOC133195515 [Saccostrea echinata]|uniref:uncharacterized protein LOC133195515 n=1 Tax=Saccostrea echinata TaxID=191078 RepID=UPI002A817E6E|nr:uncharacterized protein LOC133195515 [Saccostrea echinata]